ncbi:MAG: squalene synthase HpnC [Alphaproteobacteria bacterium]|nr:MAG: squalene synthase HpnC [Alphaproteobacteria bacterium]
MDRSTAIETPSGKGAGDENFPVGSRLIARRLRPHVATFYAFARAIDDIADNPALDAKEKCARLDTFAAVLTGESAAPAIPTAERMRASLDETGVTVRHCLDLISAFKQDAVKNRYADWAELMDYCDRSAAPVGRYLLDLHGESRALWPASDALCNSLQVINHLQDCGDDYRRLDRVYLPGGWMAEFGARICDLGASSASPGLRRTILRCVEGVHELNRAAEALPLGLKSRRLAGESAVILALARALARELARRDPLAERVELARPRFLMTGLAGLVRLVLQRFGLRISRSGSASGGERP